MFVDTTLAFNKAKTKSYTRHLLRESFRKNGRVCHRTLTNLSHCSQDEIDSLRLALHHTGQLEKLAVISEDIQSRQGPSIGATWAVYQKAVQLGIDQALGPSREGRLALWQVIARVIAQGSRLSAVRFASSHAACDVLGLDDFNEDHLYANLNWLEQNQRAIEDRLFKTRYGQTHPNLYLYDVTSTYFEGSENELAAFGYNRDKKKGKKQMVVGLLCDDAGCPLSIELFSGNTQDPQTFSAQIQKVVERWGGGEITFVGDRGMIKGPQIGELKKKTADGQVLHYISALTKPQIEVLLRKNILQMSLFDSVVAEVITDEERYVIRRNPTRANEMKANRREKVTRWSQKVEEQQAYLHEHPRASVDVATRDLGNKAKALGIEPWVTLTQDERKLRWAIDETLLHEAEKLDGCYALRTDLTPSQARKEVVHDRYKDLALVESAFRDCKTVHLEMRPVFLRNEERTRGHGVVVMLSYDVIRSLARDWQKFNITVEEGLTELAELCMTTICIKGIPRLYQVPQPRESLASLLHASHLELPQTLPHRGITVSSKKKLQDERNMT